MAKHRNLVSAIADSDSDVEIDLTSALIPQNSVTAAAKKSKARSHKNSDAMEVDEKESDKDSETEMIQRSVQAQNRKKKKSGGFQSMGLHPPLFRAIINKGFKVPTPIQRRTIPVIMQGRDVVGMARTGSGKTAAFLIPLIHRLKAHSVKVGARAIILSPSRELALQTHKVTKELIKFTDLRAVPIVGGDSLDDQFGIIASNPDVIIATPGRLLHLVVEMNLDLTTVEYIVFDEADRLFELGFAVQLQELLNRLSANRQTLLFSATLPSTLVDFAKAGLQDPELIRLDVETKISQDLEMAFFSVKHDDKEGALIYLLREVIGVPVNTDKTIISKKWRKTGDKPRREPRWKNKRKQEDSDEDEDEDDYAGPVDKRNQTIVFASTKHHVEYLNALLIEAGFAVSHVYGSLDQTARKIQIARFTTGRTQVLVVTDVAARGIDIPILENVINYDFVDSSKVFIHRVGRVARAGRRGWAYSLVTTEEIPYVLDLQLFLGRPLQLGSSMFANQTPSYNQNIILGQFPMELSDEDKVWADRVVDENVTLDGMKRSAHNGSKLYVKSKQTASSESYKRAKELQLAKSFSEPHILLSNRIKPEEHYRMEMLRNLSGFRPQETIFEIGNRGVKHSTASSLVMQNYRMVSNRHIENTKKAREQMSDPMSKFDQEEPQSKELESVLNPTTSNTYRDDDYYIPYSKANTNTEKGYAMASGGSFAEQAQGAIVSLNGDENDSLLALQHSKQSKNTLRWDSKKKRFVRGTGVGSDNRKLIRTENGTVLPASFKKGTFKEWQDKNKISIPRAGEQELGNAADRAKAGRYVSGRFQHTKITQAKPLDPLAFNYERKMKKRKAAETGDDSEKYKGTVVFSDSETTNSGGKPGRNDKFGKNDSKRTKGGIKKKGGGAPKQAVKSELKSRDQIRKDRMLKEQRRAKTGRHGKKSGQGKRR
ncbi:ATP-dependent RNA helicase dbp10 [Coemansia sp. RSA 989]|nr:ATP-dependent RNA helicase dbp10 [Coemansia sp. RSA 1086]KAJ1752153.1 ATP-dependent RNA helicase dbp10 [Coemansia sp. RSA 1821]KAJ1866896.1 ATP-dependent RNA helicase dbp10 [Coemansia sp. RSA 989]